MPSKPRRESGNHTAIKNISPKIITEVSKNCIHFSFQEQQHYTAGNIKYYHQIWKELTQDAWILDIIKYGLKLDFLHITHQTKVYNTTLSSKEPFIIDTQIKKLLKKRVISKSVHELQFKKNSYQKYLQEKKMD